VNRKDVAGALVYNGNLRCGTERSSGMNYRSSENGREVSVIGLGGHHIGRTKHLTEGIRIIRSALDRGINFMGNRWRTTAMFDGTAKNPR
jgi:hypothetical protein